MTTTFDQLVDDTRQLLLGMGLVQPRAAFLSANAGSGDLTLTVSNASDFSQGIAEIGNEAVFIDSVSGNQLTVSPDGRGYFGTTAVPHTSGTRVEFAPAFPRHQIAAALNDSIVGSWPDLYGVAIASFTYSPVQTTYPLPGTAQRILQVTIETVGPSQERIKINRYSMDNQGSTITLDEAGVPGRTVRVVYVTQPIELVSGDNFTHSGLNETARIAIRYAACSHLTAYMDVSRAVVDTGVAGEFDSSHNAVGSASKISAQLYQRYQLELNKEKGRLRSQYPSPVSMRTR